MSDNKSPQAEPETAAPPTTGCGPLARYPVLSVFVFAGAGLALGLGLSTWDPEDSQDKSTALQWIGLIGDMFIRALKATVLPLVFVSIILSVVDMMQVGRASSIGGKTIGIYFATTFFASILGLISILCFKSLFTQGTFEDPTDPRVQLGCGEGGSFLSHDTTDGSVMCSANLTEDMSSYFFITDLDGSFVMKSSGPRSDISMSDTVYDGVFRKLITSNIFESFVEANFGQYIMLVILATVGSAGSAPVPSAALVLIISAYNTVFGTTGTPDGFSFIIAIDWFVDRCRTTVNVTVDAIATGMVSHLAARDGGTFGDESAIPGAPESTLAAQSADDDSGECDA